MAKLGLALSGGGFRATLYHLGVIRYLRDIGQLSQVSDIASVSGGSILAAHLVLNWDRYTGDEERFNEASQEVIDFVQFDVRNRVVRRLPLQYILRWLVKFTPFDGGRFTPNATLEYYYRTLLYGDRCLYELPQNPKLHILTTNISNGGLSVFNREGLFIQQRHSDKAAFRHVPGEMAGIPRVVGASSAFPGLFPPVKITAEDLGVREGDFATEWFTDGGVYDNLGIRAFTWLIKQNQEFDQILVSDAGKPFQVLCDASLGFVGQSMRATDILWDRVWQLERQNFGEQAGFSFLPITDLVNDEEDTQVLPTVVQAEVQSIRTDLDKFMDYEVNALVQHGYGVARRVCHEQLIPGAEEAEGPPWTPIPSSGLAQMVAASRTSDASSSTHLARRLRKSSRRRTWSTLFSFKDWTSYLYAAVFVVLGIYLPYQIYELYRHSKLQSTVIDAVAEGDQDIRQILDLIDTNPTLDWAPVEVGEAGRASEVDYNGIEILTYSRIVDLRRWHPHETEKERRGNVYVRDRFSLKLKDSYAGDRHVKMALPVPSEDVTFRQAGSQRAARITKITEPYVEYGDTRYLYELDYDLNRIPVGEPVELVLEAILEPNDLRSRATFITRADTDLISVWMLFPSNRPYRSYNLVSYPIDRSEPPIVMNSRYNIDHPYGSLIGWSVVNPNIGWVYECRWTNE